MKTRREKEPFFFVLSNFRAFVMGFEKIFLQPATSNTRPAMRNVQCATSDLPLVHAQ
jgi:hypothetical protein